MTHDGTKRAALYLIQSIALALMFYLLMGCSKRVSPTYSHSFKIKQNKEMANYCPKVIKLHTKRAPKPFR